MNNPPAFPQPINPAEQGRGMTLRDYFAAKAMQALIDRDTFFDDVHRSGPMDMEACPLGCWLGARICKRIICQKLYILGWNLRESLSCSLKK